MSDPLDAALNQREDGNGEAKLAHRLSVHLTCRVAL